ncbi:MAG: hypothetical protein KAQ69_06340 [Spirochaetales bacterium]|nr:hypothetical protein [Spirochaetales bacterium]
MGFLKDLHSRNWEQVCTKCGLCCHEKTVSSRSVTYHLETPCVMLDPETNLCRVYDNRFREHPRCRSVNLFRAMFSTYLPQECAYVQWAKKHHMRFARDVEFFYIPSFRDDTLLDE